MEKLLPILIALIWTSVSCTDEEPDPKPEGFQTLEVVLENAKDRSRISTHTYGINEKGQVVYENYTNHQFEDENYAAKFTYDSEGQLYSEARNGEEYSSVSGSLDRDLILINLPGSADIVHVVKAGKIISTSQPLGLFVKYTYNGDEVSVVNLNDQVKTEFIRNRHDKPHPYSLLSSISLVRPEILSMHGKVLSEQVMSISDSTGLFIEFDKNRLVYTFDDQDRVETIKPDHDDIVTRFIYHD